MQWNTAYSEHGKHLALTLTHRDWLLALTNVKAIFSSLKDGMFFLSQLRSIPSFTAFPNFCIIFRRAVWRIFLKTNSKESMLTICRYSITLRLTLNKSTSSKEIQKNQIVNKMKDLLSTHRFVFVSIKERGTEQTF